MASPYFFMHFLYRGYRYIWGSNYDVYDYEKAIEKIVYIRYNIENFILWEEYHGIK